MGPVGAGLAGRRSISSFTLATMRWRFENRAPADAAVAAPDGGIAPASGTAASRWRVVCRRVLKQQAAPGADLHVAGRRVHRQGRSSGWAFPPSAARRPSDDRADQGAAPAPSARRCGFIDAGGVRGDHPGRAARAGRADARRAGACWRARAGRRCSCSASPPGRRSTLKSWDKTRIPLPFSRGCVVFDGPLTVRASRRGDAIEALARSTGRRGSAPPRRAPKRCWRRDGAERPPPTPLVADRLPRRRRAWPRRWRRPLLQGARAARQGGPRRGWRERLGHASRAAARPARWCGCTRSASARASRCCR